MPKKSKTPAPHSVSPKKKNVKKKSPVTILAKGKVFGFSLIEIIVTTAVVGILSIVMVRGVSAYMARSRDAQRKDHLQELKVAFENYHTDNTCYPEADALMDCGADTLAPYIKEIPCDPASGLPYLYDPFPSEAQTCRGFRIYADLEYDSDPVVQDLGCDSDVGCGAKADVANADYNYGVAVGVALSQKDAAITAGATAGLIESGFTCSSGGVCNVCQFVSEEGGEQCPQSNVFLSVEECQKSCK